jgi:hypothetical protein
VNKANEDFEYKLYTSAEAKYLQLLELEPAHKESLERLIEIARIYTDWGKHEFNKGDKYLGIGYYNRSQVIIKEIMIKIDSNGQLACDNIEYLIKIHGILKDIYQDLELSNEKKDAIEQRIKAFKEKRDACNN